METSHRILVSRRCRRNRVQAEDNGRKSSGKPRGQAGNCAPRKLTENAPVERFHSTVAEGHKPAGKGSSTLLTAVIRPRLPGRARNAPAKGQAGAAVGAVPRLVNGQIRQERGRQGVWSDSVKHQPTLMRLSQGRLIPLRFTPLQPDQLATVAACGSFLAAAGRVNTRQTRWHRWRWASCNPMWRGLRVRPAPLAILAAAGCRG